MALLQISEPGMAPAPHERRLAIGIDLGTTNSLVAAVRHSVAEVLPDGQGRRLLPSAVRYFPQDKPVVGHAALADAARDPKNTVISVKRLMGRSFKDIVHAESAPYDFIDAPGMVRIKTVAGIKSPVEVSADILAQLRARAEETLGGTLTGAVITVPAYFDDAQRQATKDAARLAGLEVLRLLNEPTAAAIAYGLDNAAEGIYAVYDLGGGTFDISILRLSRGVFEVLATGGDSALGGDDFDHRLYCWVLEQAGLRLVQPEDMRLLMARCREAKEHLSHQALARVHATLTDGTVVNIGVSQAQFFDMTQPLVQKTLGPVRRALRDAGIGVDEVQGVVMVGGATRMPHVQRAVGELFGRDPLNNLDPDEVVALGAAMQANLLAGNRSGDDWLLLDVIPLSLGIETMGGLVERIIPRNATIPVARAQEFTTFKDGQTAMAIHVLQGERELATDCRSLARFELRGIPAMAAGAARIRVSFQVDADGLLSVSATETGSGVAASVTVKPSYGLGDDDIARMLQDSFGAAEQDMHMRALREQQVEAERLLEATRVALAADADLLTPAERTAIDTATATLVEAARSTDTRAIKAAIDALAAATTEFAARRMDRSIRSALAGRSIDTIQAENSQS